MIYYYQHSCGGIVLVGSEEYYDFFDETNLVVALEAPCPKPECAGRIIIGVEDIGKTLLPLPKVNFEMRLEAD